MTSEANGMSAIPAILVVAPDIGFRRSLAFMMETEGFRVVTLDALAGVAELGEGGARFACAVIDDAALPGGFGPAMLELERLVWPVVLLATRIDRMPVDWRYGLVEKPLLGGSLVDAVTAAIAAST